MAAVNFLFKVVSEPFGLFPYKTKQFCYQTDFRAMYRLVLGLMVSSFSQQCDEL